MPSHPVIAYAIASCLVEAGLKPDNIIVWEREEGAIKTIGTNTKGYGYDERRSEKAHGISALKKRSKSQSSSQVQFPKIRFKRSNPKSRQSDTASRQTYLPERRRLFPED